MCEVRRVREVYETSLSRTEETGLGVSLDGERTAQARWNIYLDVRKWQQVKWMILLLVEALLQ